MPALYPDVAAIHVHEADRYGNCRIRGTTVADVDLARAAKRLIITCERLIPNEEIRADPDANGDSVLLRGRRLRGALRQLSGQHALRVFSDEEHLRLWLDVETDLGRFQEFLEKYLFGVRDFMEYLDRCGGLRRMQQLRQQELLLQRGHQRPAPERKAP